MTDRWLFPTGLDINPAAGGPDPAMFGSARITSRINIKSAAALYRLSRWASYGHAVYALFGTEAPGAGYEYSEAGLGEFLDDYAPCIMAVTNRNEWDTEPNIARTRAENAWAHSVCRARGVPFAISSTLVQDWHGETTGLGGVNVWPGLWNLYGPGEVDGDLVDLHLYSYGDGSNLARMLTQYRSMGYQEPTVIGEFGTRIGEEIPVREMFDAVLDPALGVASAMLFSLQDFDDPNKLYGLLRQDGSQKDAFEEFIQVARERQDQKYIMGGIPPVPTPRFTFFPGQAFEAFATGHPDLGLVPTSPMWYEAKHGVGDETFEVVFQDTNKGVLRYNSIVGVAELLPFDVPR